MIVVKNSTLRALFLVTAVSLLSAGATVFAATLRVDGSTGVDNAGCGSAASPCQSIQQAVNLAGDDDMILVATGTYTYDASLDPCTPLSTVAGTGVVCVIDTTLTILGGYPHGNWTVRNPAGNPTVIDGANLHRGVYFHNGPFQLEKTLTLEGFTIKRGLAQGATSGPDLDTYAFGGGLRSALGHVVLRDLVFTDNLAAGGNTSSTYGGAGAGGGLAISGYASRQVTAILERISFVGNEARGGTNPQRGGFGQGGALFANYVDLAAHTLVFTDNLAIAGDSAGSGLGGGLRADAQGGAAAFQIQSNSTLEGVTATGNRALGGDGGSDPGDQAGAGIGGAFLVEQGSLTLRDADIRSSEARGGASDSGGSAYGGGIAATSSTVTLDRVVLIDNLAAGGDGITTTGGPGGGGGNLTDTVATVTNTLIADNVAQLGTTGGLKGGGGGGLFLTGGTQMSMSHSTFARNRLGSSPLGGIALILVTVGAGCVADLDYTVIADHTEFSGIVVALHVQPGSTVNLDTGVFAGNETDTNFNHPNIADGTFNGLGTMTSAASMDFVSPGPPDYDYHILDTSPAVDLATTSTIQVDFEGQTRTGLRDAGHDELGQGIFTDGFESGDVSAWSTTVGGP